MNDCITTFFSAWGDPDPASRASKTAASAAPSLYYNDPNAPAPIVGVDGYLAYIASFSEMAPGASAQVAHIDANDACARITVNFVFGPNMAKRGQYFAEIADDKITRIIGFTGMGEPT